MQKDNPEETTPSPINADEALEDTLVSPVADATDETTPAEQKKKGWLRAAGLGILAFILITGLFLFGGAQTGQADKAATLALVNAVEANIQEALAREDIAAGRCDVASQRVDWIQSEVPEYAGLLDLLVVVQLCNNAGPTTAPIAATATPSYTPTPDGRSADEIFTDILAFKNAEEWDLLLGLLDNIRAHHPDYKTVEVDNLYYYAFRNRGGKRILLEGNLEGGIFDLTQAERFGKLDTEAQSYRQWAEWYVAGQSYWEVNWGQSVLYFELVAYAAPNLSDSNYFTATARLAEAKIGYANDLIARSEYLLTVKGWCAADTNYKLAFSYIPMDPVIQPTAQWATLKCELNPDEGPKE